jgi:hypothetical protein
MFFEEYERFQNIITALGNLHAFIDVGMKQIRGRRRKKKGGR